jgi:hypothetical protein
MPAELNIGLWKKCEAVCSALILFFMFGVPLNDSLNDGSSEALNRTSDGSGYQPAGKEARTRQG